MNLRPFTKRLAPWLTAYLLLVSIGLPLQRVYCACVGEQWVTVLTEGNHDCHHETKEQPDVHQHTAMKCCKGEKAAQETTCVSPDCGDSEMLIAQLDADFTTEASALDLSITAIVPPAATIWWSVSPEPSGATPIRGPTPPPPPAGRQLLVAHQTFLI